MSGSSFGRFFKITTFGESHGPAVGCVVDGMPAGYTLTEKDIQKSLDQRAPGKNAFTSPRQEKDQVHILSGVFEERTLGTPICLIVYNQDARSRDYQRIKDAFRPGHGDYTYQKKYGCRDWRGGGRASARETVARVAAGAVANRVLSAQRIQVFGFLSQVGDLKIPTEERYIEFAQHSPFFCAHPDYVAMVEEKMHKLKSEGDSIGAKINICVKGLPIGLGQPVFDKLEADLAKGVMSIPAVKGVSFGDGFDVVTQRGSEHRDEITQDGFLSNHAGGTLAGISTGQDVTLSVALKPTSSIAKVTNTVNQKNERVRLAVRGRHDPCVGLRAVPIIKAMVQCILTDHWLMRYGESHFMKEQD